MALVEKRPTLGGTCLNVGCIPSKALLHSSEQLVFAKEHAASHGIKLDGVGLDLAALMRRKSAVVSKLVGGVAQLAKARGGRRCHGRRPVQVGRTPWRFRASSGAASELAGRNIVIATGSAPVELPFMKFDGKTVVSSDEAISFDRVPGRLVVVGGGAIGLELGSVWARLGSDVTVVEFLPKIVASFDDDVVRTFTRLLQKQGLKIETGAKVTGLKPAGPGGVVLSAEREGKLLEFPADRVLVAVGRRPYADGLELEKAGVERDGKGRIKVDDHLRTSAAGVWAIGDVVAGPMLAHKAEEDGVAVAEWIAGRAGHVNWDLVPAIVYTEPEVAGVGLGEDAAKAQSIAAKVGKFNFAANGRAIASDATDGFAKIIADAQDRPDPRLPDHRPRGRRTDLRGRDPHGVRRKRRGSRPDDPRASDPGRGGQGGWPGGLQVGDPCDLGSRAYWQGNCYGLDCRACPDGKPLTCRF